MVVWDFFPMADDGFSDRYDLLDPSQQQQQQQHIHTNQITDSQSSVKSVSLNQDYLYDPWSRLDSHFDNLARVTNVKASNHLHFTHQKKKTKKIRN